MSDRALKDQLYESFAQIGKSFSSSKRLELLDILTEGPKSVERLAKISNMSMANVSQHLQTLYQANMVTYVKQGNYVIYSLADASISDFLIAFHQLAEKRSIKVKQIKSEFLNINLGLDSVSLEQLQELMENESVVLLDVRPTDEYEAGHIPGAISIPIEELEDKLDDIPNKKEIVAYCRGQYCLTSIKATEMLLKKGFKAFRLENNVRDWQKFEKEKEKNSES